MEIHRHTDHSFTGEVLITDENWYKFIRGFFHIGVTDEWLDHIITNWNYVGNKSGCPCSWAFFRDPQWIFCDDFLGLQTARIQDEEKVADNSEQ